MRLLVILPPLRRKLAGSVIYFTNIKFTKHNVKIM